ncbi:MAG: hypothetical protein ACI4JJ_04855 [Huintestinicola sp.]
MTLLITVFAAIISTVIWYTNEKARKLNVSLLCFMYWGASLMWLVDAFAEYGESGAEYFLPEAVDMINDGFLGFSAAAFGMVIWLVSVMVKDPSGVLKTALKSKK